MRRLFCMMVLMIMMMVSPVYAMDKVSLATDYIHPYSLYVPFIYGIEKGIYKAEGIDLKVILTQGGHTSTLSLASKSVDFGICGGQSVAQSVSKGLPVMCISNLAENNWNTVFYKGDSGIKTFKDLDGKSVVLSPKTAKGFVVKTIAKKQGVNINFVSGQPSRSVEYTSFLTGKTDFYVGSIAENAHRVVKDGDIRWFTLKEYIDNGPAYCLATNIETIEKRPDVIVRFIRATIKSIEESRNNKEEAVKIFVKTYPEMKYDDVIQSWPITATYLTSLDKKTKFGMMYEERWLSLIRSMEEFEEIQKGSVSTSKVYTNQFVIEAWKKLKK